jgi:hypothetical protein
LRGVLQKRLENFEVNRKFEDFLEKNINDPVKPRKISISQNK